MSPTADLIGAWLFGIATAIAASELGATVASWAWARWQGRRWWQEPTRVEALRALLEDEK
jgi:hypothetical protein